MRLTCPNCGAQYEVDGSMIPDDGRDVQCSACGQTWFQAPEGAEIAEAEAATGSAERQPEPEPEPAPGPEPDAEAETAFVPPPEETDAADDGEADEVEVGTDETPDEPVAPPRDAFAQAEDDNWAEEDDDAFDDEFDQDDRDGQEASADASKPDALPAASPVPPSQRLDETVLTVLREEAAREAEARRAEQAQALETQAELGLTEGEGIEDRRGVRAHVARMRGEDPEREDDALPGSRGDLLPDIDQLNSTLRPASEHAEAVEVADPVVVEAQHRRGFRWGFTLMIVIAALLAIGYVFAPQIAQQAPTLEPAVVGYVDSVNSVRDGLEGLLTRTTESISNATSGDADGE
jgi:predicted Zn finger-like uncharacterized protein